MSREGQRLDPDRYTIVPRTLTFLRRPGEILLLRLSESRGSWAGRLNGIGGHVERGEGPMQSAKREILEETGLTAGELRLVGVVLIDTGERPGIGLYVFVGEAGDGPSRSGSEGQVEWCRLATLEGADLVEDLPILLPKALSCYESGSTFTALYRYDDADQLSITFSS